MALDNNLSKDSHSSVNYHGLNHNRIRIPSLPYAKKWRILIALLVGISIIGVCILVFYLSAEGKNPHEGVETLTQSEKLAILSSDENLKKWRLEDECLTSQTEKCPKEFGDIPVFLLVLGGLRVDQVSEMPALLEYVKCGSSAKSLVPSYPTFNYPNLYSIATGLYPESHGIVSYKMYDKDLNLNFSIDSPSSFNSGWWRGEPIWNTVGKSGKKSATYLWPGANVQIQGSYPSYWQKEKMDFVTRIKKVINWIELPAEERPQLIMMYYEEPVTTSVQYGPFSPRTVEQLSTINVGLDELMTKLIEADLLNCVNIIIASEHGVAASACDNSLYIEDFLDEAIPGNVYTGTVGRIDFAEDSDKNIVDKITKTLQCKKSGLRVLKKNEVPIRYHYTKGSRIGDLILDTRSGLRIATESDNKCLEGEFGYDNSLRSMQGVFIGHGPSFRVGYRAEAFRNVEIYDLLSFLLEVEPALNNGTSGSLLHLLRKDLVKESDYKEQKQTFLKESIKPLPVRPNNAVLGRYSEVHKSSKSCSCVHETPSVTVAADVNEQEISAATQESILSSVTTTTTESSTTSTTTTSSTTTTESTTTTSSTTTTESTTTSPSTTSPESQSSSLSTSETDGNEEIISSSTSSTDKESLASSVSSTEPSTTSSTHSVLISLPDDETTMTPEEPLSAQNASLLDSSTSAALIRLISESSSSAEISLDELTTLSFISPVGLSSEILSESSPSTEQSIVSSNNSTEYAQVTTPFTTTKKSGPEARHVAEIILAHEHHDNSEHNDTTEDIVLEPPHRAESLVANENQFDIINVEDSFHHDQHHKKESLFVPEEQQNSTENLLDTTLVTEPSVNLDENNDQLHNIHENPVEVTSAPEQLDNALEEQTQVADKENVQDNATAEVKEEQHKPEIAKTVEHTIEAQQLDLLDALEHIAPEETTPAVETSELDHTTVDLKELEISEVSEQSHIIEVTEPSQISEVTEPSLVAEDQQIGDTIKETDVEHESLIAEPENKLLTSEQHHENKDIIHEEETPTTEDVPLLIEVAPEETKAPAEQTLAEMDASHSISEVESRLHEAGHEESQAAIPETANIESHHEEIEILPIPQSLKSMNLIKDEHNINIKDEARLQSFHCPWGFPSFSAPEVASDILNILLHSSHIIGLPESLNLGVWTSFSMNKEGLEELNKARPAIPDGLYVSPEEKQNNLTVGCWISDSRLQRSSSDQCSRTFQTDLYKFKNASLRQLFPEELELPSILEKEGYLLSNLAPVMKGFEDGPRHMMNDAIKKWTKEKGSVNVVHGPVFDYDFDGRRDDITVIRNTIKPLIPSSYFYVVTICNETKSSKDSESEESEESTAESFNSCPLSKLNVYSFVFPNTDNDMCLMSNRDYLLYHLASLADVEDLTSLKFFRNMDHKFRVQLRARQPLRLPAI